SSLVILLPYPRDTLYPYTTLFRSRSQAKMKDIKIIQKSSIDSFIYCDKSQVKQVLINIVKNAIEAMDEPGNILITNETNDSFVEDRKSTRLNSSHVSISYAVFCLN